MRMFWIWSSAHLISSLFLPIRFRLASSRFDRRDLAALDQDVLDSLKVDRRIDDRTAPDQEFASNRHRLAASFFEKNYSFIFLL